MKSIQIKDSYDVWLPRDQKWYANRESYEKYGEHKANILLHRTWTSIHIKWWLYNIGYYITKKFMKNERMKVCNLLFKNIELEDKRDE